MARTPRGRLAAIGAGLALIVAIGAILTGRHLGVGPFWGDARDVSVPAPTREQADALATKRIVFAHQSVGWNILAGVPPVLAAASGNAASIVETRTAPSQSAFLAHFVVGTNGDPLGKFADFAATVDSGFARRVDGAVMKLCYLDVVATTDVRAVFDAYESTMTALEAKHPDIAFFYTTAPLTADHSVKGALKAVLGHDDLMGPADNVARERYNALVRERYAATNRLIDIAAVQSTLGDGPTARSSGGQPYHVLNRTLASDAGHLNEHGSQLVAAEFVRVVGAALS